MTYDHNYIKIPFKDLFHSSTIKQTKRYMKILLFFGNDFHIRQSGHFGPKNNLFSLLWIHFNDFFKISQKLKEVKRQENCANDSSEKKLLQENTSFWAHKWHIEIWIPSKYLFSSIFHNGRGQKVYKNYINGFSEKTIFEEIGLSLVPKWLVLITLDVFYLSI